MKKSIWIDVLMKIGDHLALLGSHEMHLLTLVKSQYYRNGGIEHSLSRCKKTPSPICLKISTFFPTIPWHFKFSENCV